MTGARPVYPNTRRPQKGILTARVPLPLSPVTTTNCGSLLDVVDGVSCWVRVADANITNNITTTNIFTQRIHPPHAPYTTMYCTLSR